jgi:hypothetical protein
MKTTVPVVNSQSETVILPGLFYITAKVDLRNTHHSETTLSDAVLRDLRGRRDSFEFWSGTPVTRSPWVEDSRYSYTTRPNAALCTYLQVHRGLFGVLPPTASSPHVVRPRSAICSDSVRCLPPTF